MIKYENAVIRLIGSPEIEACRAALISSPPFVLSIHGHRGYVVRLTPTKNEDFTFVEAEILHTGPQYCGCKQIPEMTDNYATDDHTASTISGDGTTDYERVDKLFAERGRRSTNEVYEGGMRITDFGHFKKKRTGPTIFTFNATGHFISMSRWFKGRWLLRGSGVRTGWFN